MERKVLNPHSPFFHEERHHNLGAVRERLITICGAGALGGNLTETLARMGFACLKIIDRDRVEMRNLSTQPYSRTEVGSPKARALANQLYRAVQAKVEAQVVELTATNASQLLKDSDLVVDAFDNRGGRSVVSSTVLTLNLPCLHLGFSPDGLYGSGIWEPGYVVPGGGGPDPCDYPLTRPLAIMLAALGARAIADFLVEGRAESFELTWQDLKISRI